MTVSRRQFLCRSAALGGLATGYAALQALGMIPSAPAYAGRPELVPNSGRGLSVIILGAGQAGLAAALELEKVGYTVTILEARSRVGGKVWSIRGGTDVRLDGFDSQRCSFDEGLYFNAGAARIPSQHVRVLDYCRSLGVRLEPEINISQSALLLASSTNGGHALTQRRVTFDMRGRIAELLTKAAAGGALDQQLSAEDRDRLAAFLRDYGDLNDDGNYRGSTRGGYAKQPSTIDLNGQPNTPLSLHELLANPELKQIDYAESLFNQPTMLQPVGGMDHIPFALARAIRGSIRLGCAVTDVRIGSDDVSITYRGSDGNRQIIKADFVINTLPLPIMARITSNLPASIQAIFAKARYGHATKVAFEAPRFWERDQIYGGISFVQGDTSLVWYPSGELMAPRGILIGCYAINSAGERMHRRSLQERIDLSRDAVESLHPGHRAELSKAIVVDWKSEPFSQGPWVEWGDQDSNSMLLALSQPQGRLVFAGAHMSPFVHWQEGAFMSAHQAVTQISNMAATSQSVDTRG